MRHRPRATTLPAPTGSGRRNGWRARGSACWPTDSARRGTRRRPFADSERWPRAARGLHALLPIRPRVIERVHVLRPLLVGHRWPMILVEPRCLLEAVLRDIHPE